MQMMNYRLFQGTEAPIEIFNGQPILDTGFQFFYDDCGTETDFDFPGFSSAYLKVYNERSGRVLKTITLTRQDNILVLNTEDTDFEDNGNYYYEVIYVQSGGYEIVLRFGQATVI